MRVPKRLSLSALSLAESNREEYFLRYICPTSMRPARSPQTGPMSVGSAFDAIVKSFINRELDLQLEGFRMRDLVAQQCDPETLPESFQIACVLWDQYKECGAYDNLIELIKRSANSCKMEYDLTSTIEGVALLGKPDLHFETSCGAHVITDWKVSGSCSKCGVSPQQGYMLALDTNNTRTHGQPHSKFVSIEHSPGVIVSAIPMDKTTDYWADQLTTYAWCLGEPIGSQNFIARIEQIAVRPGLRAKCCVHQAKVSVDHQHRLLERYQKLWEACQSGHIFDDVSRSESDDKCEAIIRRLTTQATGPLEPSTPDLDEIGDWF